MVRSSLSFLLAWPCRASLNTMSHHRRLLPAKKHFLIAFHNQLMFSNVKEIGLRLKKAISCLLRTINFPPSCLSTIFPCIFSPLGLIQTFSR